MNNLYRRKYLIGIYAPLDEGETLLGLCDNAKEFAEFMDISINNALTILKKLFDGKHHFIRFYGKCCSVEFIEYEE